MIMMWGRTISVVKIGFEGFKWNQSLSNCAGFLLFDMSAQNISVFFKITYHNI